MLAPLDGRHRGRALQPRGDEGVPTVTTAGKIATALARADHVIDLLPDNAGSENFFNAACFRAMKRGAVFYNIGRGNYLGSTSARSPPRSASGKLAAAAWLERHLTPEPLPQHHRPPQNPHLPHHPHIAGNHPTWAERR